MPNYFTESAGYVVLCASVRKYTSTDQESKQRISCKTADLGDSWTRWVNCDWRNCQSKICEKLIVQSKEHEHPSIKVECFIQISIWNSVRIFKLGQVLLQNNSKSKKWKNHHTALSAPIKLQYIATFWPHKVFVRQWEIPCLVESLQHFAIY